MTFPTLEAALQTYDPLTNGPTSSSTGSTGSTASSGSTAEQAKEKAKEQAQQAAGQARGVVRNQVDQRSTQAGERVTTVASDVRTIGEQLREQGKDQPAKLAEQAADRTERIGNYLRDSDADRILSDVEDFGRRQPWAVMAGGVALGLVASRFLKASSSRRYESRYQSRYESSGYLPARTGDTYTRSGLGATSPATSGLGTSGAGLGTTGATSDLGSVGTRGTSDLGARDLDVGATPPPVRREPGFDDPALGRPAEDVSLTGGVLPPRSDSEGSR
jgi:hypothetical protein